MMSVHWRVLWLRSFQWKLARSTLLPCWSMLAVALSAAGVPIAEHLLLTAAMCVFSAWLAKRLHAVEDQPVPTDLLDEHQP